jgi:hypothetical protein
MPFYEFECPNGHVFEKMVEMGTEKEWCPTCNEWAKDLPYYNMEQFMRLVAGRRILSPTMTTFRHASNVKRQ